MLAVLRHRNLALLVAAQTISFTGSFVLFVGLPFYVYELTGSGLATGALFMAQTIPQLALGSVAGVFVDRWDRRHIRMTADVVRVVVLLPLLAVPSTDWVWIVYAVALTEAAIGQFSNPATLAIIPRLVAPQHLVQANSLNSTTSHVALLVGSALGGTLLAIGGLSLVVFVDAATFLASALLVLLIPAALGKLEPTTDAAATAARRSVFSELTEGLALVRADRLLVAIFAASTLVGIADGIILAGIVIFVRDVLDAGSVGFGWLLTARGLGGVLGGLIVAQFGVRISERRLMPAAIFAMALIFAGLANIHILPVAMLMLLLTGPPAMAFMVSVQTLLQRTVADAFRGRVFGVYATVVSIASLTGMGLSATTLDSIGPVAIFNVAAACNLLATAALLLAFRRAPAPDPAPEDRHPAATNAPALHTSEVLSDLDR
ncbi:MAG: MFS transporter [Dehalococcoidia bacterium]|jgi:predicted MFS family arabinose efflux permease|nr:MFS transporter [Dehalococcoidia bacterium]